MIEKWFGRRRLVHNFTLAEIASITGGVVHGDGALTVANIAIDSREVEQGSLFCAIFGERSDGHDYVTNALTAGASATLASRAVDGPHIVVPPSPDGSESVIYALGRLAKHKRTLMSKTRVIGITGSSGKTSTKDLIGQVLKTHGSTVVPAGSANNELGLPLTVLGAPDDVEYLVLEMGMRGFGHITYLCDIAHPTISVVTNVGHAHVGEVGSQENIARAKSEIVRDLSSSDVAIFNLDDPFVAGMRNLTQAKVVTYGLSELADIRASNLVVLPNGSSEFDLIVDGESGHVELQLLGQHNVYNALAAAAVGHTVGMSLAHIVQALSEAKSMSDWRMQVTKLPDGITLINDAYNANPESMAAALRTLAGLAKRGHSWAVLGVMAELGEFTLEQHDAIGRLAVRLDITHLVVVGNEAKVMHLGASQEGSWDGESVWFPDFSSACDYIVERAQHDDVVLFKASRAARFEQLCNQVESGLRTRQGDTAG